MKKTLNKATNGPVQATHQRPTTQTAAAPKGAEEAESEKGKAPVKLQNVFAKSPATGGDFGILALAALAFDSLGTFDGKPTLDFS